MNLSGNTVLVTGGGSGIGLAIATRFLQAGSKVVICGRRVGALEEASKGHPGLKTIQCDVGLEEERLKLFAKMTHDYPGLNVLVNNAGIQNRPPSILEKQDWKSHAKGSGDQPRSADAPDHVVCTLSRQAARSRNHQCHFGPCLRPYCRHADLLRD